MLLDGNAIDLNAAAKLLPNRPHISTLWRWCRKGVNGIRLDYWRAGRRILTTPEALERFCTRLAEADRAGESRPSDTPTLPRSRTEKQRRQDVERAEKTCAQAGI
ncbi:MAG: DUF1580 domain-containing protein [Phycisphaerae bacterium]